MKLIVLSIILLSYVGAVFGHDRLTLDAYPEMVLVVKKADRSILSLGVVTSRRKVVSGWDVSMDIRPTDYYLLPWKQSMTKNSIKALNENQFIKVDEQQRMVEFTADRKYAVTVMHTITPIPWRNISRTEINSEIIRPQTLHNCVHLLAMERDGILRRYKAAVDLEKLQNSKCPFHSLGDGFCFNSESEIPKKDFIIDGSPVFCNNGVLRGIVVQEKHPFGYIAVNPSQRSIVHAMKYDEYNLTRWKLFEFEDKVLGNEEKVEKYKVTGQVQSKAITKAVKSVPKVEKYTTQVLSKSTTKALKNIEKGGKVTTRVLSEITTQMPKKITVMATKIDKTSKPQTPVVPKLVATRPHLFNKTTPGPNLLKPTMDPRVKNKTKSPPRTPTLATTTVVSLETKIPLNLSHINREPEFKDIYYDYSDFYNACYYIENRSQVVKNNYLIVVLMFSITIILALNV